MPQSRCEECSGHMHMLWFQAFSENNAKKSIICRAAEINGFTPLPPASVLAQCYGDNALPHSQGWLVWFQKSHNENNTIRRVQRTSFPLRWSLLFPSDTQWCSEHYEFATLRVQMFWEHLKIAILKIWRWWTIGSILKSQFQARHGDAYLNFNPQDAEADKSLTVKSALKSAWSTQ